MDLIDRDELIQRLFEFRDKNPLVKDCIDEIIYGIVNRLESHTKTAHWIPRKLYHGVREYSGLECSNCGMFSCNKLLQDSNYCPNCGAKIENADG